MSSERTTALGLWTLAEEYFEAGKVVQVAAKGRISRPAYYLYTHGIELALKAYLRGCGFTLDQLKCMGHDIGQILAEATACDLLEETGLDRNEVGALLRIGPYYRNKELEYTKIGFKRYPILSLLESAGKKLLKGAMVLFRKNGLV